MDVIDRTLKYVDLFLVKDLSTIPEYLLPEGYQFTFFQDGDEKDWVEIEKSSGEFLCFEEGMEAFQKYYGNSYEELKKRCIFIENDKGEKIATATAFYLEEPLDDIEGNVHWFSIKKEYQGNGLAKPMLSKTLQIMRDFGYQKTLLHTQTSTWLAVKVYLDMGFEPYHLEDSYLGWQIIKRLTNHKKLEDVSDIADYEMYNPLYIQAFEYLKSRYREPFDYKVWDEKGPVIGIHKDDSVHYYLYSYENGRLDILSEKDENFRMK